MNVRQIDHLNMTVRDMDETAAWYRRVFDFSLVEEGISNGVRWAILRGGDAMLCIYEFPEYRQPSEGHLSEHRLHHISHFGLWITDKTAWENTLRQENLALTYGPIDYPHSRSWYVEDPNGYEIEVAWWNDGAVRFSGRTGDLAVSR